MLDERKFKLLFRESSVRTDRIDSPSRSVLSLDVMDLRSIQGIGDGTTSSLVCDGDGGGGGSSSNCRRDPLGTRSESS